MRPYPGALMMATIAGMIGGSFLGGPSMGHSRDPRPRRPDGADERDMAAAEARRQRRAAKRLAEAKP